LLDVLNLTLFCAPIGILGVFAWLFGGTRPKGGTVVDHEAAAQTVVLSIAAASLWLFAFWIDPLIGGFRDWDLLGLFGIPMSVWAAAVLARAQSPGDQKWMNWLVVAVFAVVHTGGFVWSVQREEAAALRVDRMVRQDMHYSEQFHKGERRTSWADMLSRELGRDDLAKVHNQVRLAYAPTHSSAWHNLAVNFWNLGQPDSAIIAQTRAANYSPRNPAHWRELGLLCMKTGDLACIRNAYEELLAIEDTSYSERNTLASVYIDLGAHSLASSLLERSLRQSPKRHEAHFLLGVLSERTGDSASAVMEYQEAIRLGGELEELKLRLSRLLPSNER
jgi:Flp pilus assembly protein TadD